MATIEETLDKAIEAAVLRAHPVGSYFITESADNPAEIFGGGVWQKLEGRVLLGTSSSYLVGTEGGEAMHTLTVSEIPSHTHAQYVTANPGLGIYNTRKDFNSDENNLDKYYQLETGATGGGNAHNNLPPYRAVNIWRRTS